MKPSSRLTLIVLGPLAVLAACETEPGPLPTGLDLGPQVSGNHVVPSENDQGGLAQYGWSAWTVPVNIGAPVNGTAGEFNPTMSSDQLSLYFNSPRVGGVGAGDIWVSRRECQECAWGPPTNLGPAVNSTSGDTEPDLSADGHLLFFASDRPVGMGGQDIYVSRRHDIHDDLAWGPPMNLGPNVNTALAEIGPAFVQGHQLFFSRGRGVGPAGSQGADLYVALVTPDGEVHDPANLVDELRIPGADENGPTLSRDGREIFFASHPAELTAGLDLWAAARQSVTHAWSAPVNLGPPVNVIGQSEFGPSLSDDGRTLLFHAGPARGGVGGFDLWVTTRTRVHP